jgi:hypothetical protein
LWVCFGFSKKTQINELTLSKTVTSKKIGQSSVWKSNDQDYVLSDQTKQLKGLMVLMLIILQTMQTIIKRINDAIGLISLLLSGWAGYQTSQLKLKLVKRWNFSAGTLIEHQQVEFLDITPHGCHARDRVEVVGRCSGRYPAGSGLQVRFFQRKVGMSIQFD